MTTFNDLSLCAPLAQALTALGYTDPTPIQAEAIPHLLKGRDLLGIAQTGTGKTAAFALPALNHIHKMNEEPPKRSARVLVLAPTRELVAQIADSFVSYGRQMDYLSIARVTGGVALGPQIKKLSRGNDVIVATPGRLNDLLDRKAIVLSGVEMLILDEADQMMDMGFVHALRKIITFLPETRQTLFFSATLPPKIKNLANSFLTDPVRVTVSPPNSTAERVTQSLTFARKEDKPMLLATLLLEPDVERSLVFTRTKHGADRVVRRLAQAGLPALAIHGNKSQGQRQRALAAFKDRKVDILVATDVAARGIDIPGITHVFNYEIPNVAEQYVHRIGRTARASASGRAIAFVAPDEKPYLKDIQKLLGEQIPVEPMPEDMAERIKIINARDKVEAVNTAPEQGRSGRGKSRKKSRRNEGGRGRGRNESRSEGRGENRRDSRKPDGPRATRPARRDESKPQSEGGHTHSLRESPKPAPARSGDSRRAAPSRRSKSGPKGGAKGGFDRKPARHKPAQQSASEGRSERPSRSESASRGADGERSARPQGSKPRSGKPHSGKPHSGKPRSGKPHSGKPHTSKGDKPKQGRRPAKAQSGKPQSRGRGRNR